MAEPSLKETLRDGGTIKTTRIPMASTHEEVQEFIRRDACEMIYIDSQHGPHTEWDVARICTAAEIKATYHHHTDNTAEDFDQFKRLMSMTDPDVFHVMVDTGHITKDMKGVPANAVISHFADRLIFIELKDYTHQTNLTTEVGHGDCDYDSVWQTLRDIDYSGWLVVEQNGAAPGRTPRESARLSRESIRAGTGC